MEKRFHNGTHKLLPLSSCKTKNVTRGHKSATKIFGSAPFQDGEGEFFLVIEGGPASSTAGSQLQSGVNTSLAHSVAAGTGGGLMSSSAGAKISNANMSSRSGRRQGLSCLSGTSKEFVMRAPE